MSANGALSSTLDFEFAGGGYLNIVGGVDVSFNLAIDSTSAVYIVGESTNNSISYTLDASAQMPGIFAVLEQEIPFSFSGTAEFGVQRWAEANNRIDFTFGTMTGYNLTHGALNKTIPFSVSITADQFSLGETAGSFAFIFSGKAVNKSTHTYDRVGKNGVNFRHSYNGVLLSGEMNDVKIIKNVHTDVTILPPA